MKRSDKVVIQSKEEKKKVVVSSIQQVETEAEAEAEDIVNGLSLYDQWVHEYL